MPDLSVYYRTIVVVLGVVNFILGVLFLLLPAIIIKVNEVSNRWIATDKIMKVLEERHDVDSRLLSARKVIGFASIVIGAVLIFLYVKKI